jgi:hypothetical protein
MIQQNDDKKTKKKRGVRPPLRTKNDIKILESADTIRRR